MKNHLLQAFAAIDFAEKINKNLHFHVNLGRIEMKGEPILNNLKGLFQHLYERGHRLINHDWTPRNEFLKLCATMDIGLQVSLSETFNIVCADHLSQGIPIVASSEVPYAVPLFTGNPVDTVSITNALILAFNSTTLNVNSHKYNLSKYVKESEKIWVNYFKG